MQLFEGGNVIVTDKNGKLIPAERIPVKAIGRNRFIKDVKELIKTFNKLFEKKYKEPLWPNINQLLKGGILFNGSASFLLDEDIPDDKVLPYKESAGDIDLIVPKDKKEKLWEFLNLLIGKKINDKWTFINHNKENFNKIIDQINALFKYCPKKDLCVFSQIDFELLPFVAKDLKTGQTTDNSDEVILVPSEWAKFGHSSSLKDIQNGLKGVAQKVLIRSISYGVSKNPDIILVTSKADCDNWRKKIKKKQDHHLLKFSVSKGIRIAAEPLICNGRQVEYDGKLVFKEIQPKNSIYETELSNIFKMLFGKEPTPQELEDIWSFVGLVNLMKKYLNEKQIKLAIERMFELFWDNKDGKNIAQEIDRDNPAEDEKVKMSTINFLRKYFPHIVDEVYKEWKDKINDYYNNYGKGKDLFKRAMQNVQ